MKKSYLIIIILTVIGVLLLSALIFLILKKPRTVNKNQTELTKEESKDSKKELSFDKEAMKEDPFMDPSGPFFHKVYKAASKDGIKFTKTDELIIDKASVPDAVKMPNGRLIIYAVDGAQRSKSGLMLAISNDNGRTWEQGSLRIKANKLNGAADPQAVLLPDNSVRLYYLVFPDKKPPLDATGKPIPTNERNHIKSAISRDGINFTEEEGSRYETTKILTDPDVIKIASKWYMYLSEGQTNLAFSSDDGMTFKEERAIRKDGAISKTVEVANGSYRQFYCKEGISSALTTDGLRFTNEILSLESSSDEIICDPTPVKVGDEWLMFYKSATPPKNLKPKQ